MERKNHWKEIYHRRTLFVLAGFSIFVLLVAFFNYQMDDEIYISPYDYTGYPEEASFENGVLTVDETSGLKKGDVIAEIPAMHFDAGTYTIDIDHQSIDDFEAVIYDGNDEIDRVMLPADELNTKYVFSSDKNLYNLKIVFLYNGTGYNTIKRSIIYSVNRPFYSDTICFAILIISMAVVIAITIIELDFFRLPVEEKAYYAVLILFALYINYPFLRPYVPSGGDVGYHVARTENIYIGLLQGQFPVGLYSELMHGRGMISAMYPHLFFVIPAILRMLHVSMEAAFRVFYMCMNLATCVTSYYAGRVLSRNDKKWAMLTMILYCVLPYRVTTMTWRFAYGETLAFIFLPLVVAGLYEIIIGDKRKWYVLVLGMTGLIECHLLSAIQGAMLCSVFGVFYLATLMRERRIVQVIYAAGMTILLNVWFIAPFLYYYKSDILTTYLGTGDMAFISYFWADMLQFLPNSSESSQIFHQMGIIGIGTIIMGVTVGYLLFVKKQYDKRDKFAIILLSIATIFIFAASKDFPWKTLEKFKGVYSALSKFQFSGRFYMLGEGLLLMGGIIVLSDVGFFRYRKQIILIVLATTIIQSMMITDTYLNRGRMFIDARAMRYMPNIADAMEYDFYAPAAYDDENFPRSFSSPEASIDNYWHSGIYTEFCYRTEADTFVDLPLTSYLGYSAKVKETGEQLQILQGESGCIRISLPARKESTRVCLIYVGYPFQNIMTVISILALFGYLFVVAFDRWTIKWKHG